MNSQLTVNTAYWPKTLREHSEHLRFPPIYVLLIVHCIDVFMFLHRTKYHIFYVGITETFSQH